MKMNNHGQTLVLFIIFIPVLFMLCAFIIDTGVVVRENIKLSSTSKMILTEALEKDYSESMIKELFLENDIPTDNIEITKDTSQIAMRISYQKNSIFASMIGIKHYEIKLSATCKKEEEKYIFQKD